MTREQAEATALACAFPAIVVHQRYPTTIVGRIETVMRGGAYPLRIISYNQPLNAAVETSTNWVVM